MISITDNTKCCGCSACAQKCPKQCIKMTKDKEGFLYPVVDTNQCIDCHLCEKVCPELNNDHPRKPLNCYASIHSNQQEQIACSSGGAITMLSEKIIEKGGIVFGCGYDKDWNACHKAATSLDSIKEFSGSKYIQSNVNDTFSNAEKALKEGLLVLFTGTPCQIAGLKHYLNHEYENLLTIDFVCHGVGSPKMWQIYLQKFKKFDIKQIHFRNKKWGWVHFCFHIKYNDKGKDIDFYEDLIKNPYLYGFIHNVYLRPSCSNCPAKNFSSGSDITCGDFWGIEKSYPNLYDDKGVSLVTANTQKGKEFLSLIKEQLTETDFDKSIVPNQNLFKSINHHPYRNLFMKYATKSNFKYLLMFVQVLKKIKH